MTASAQAPSAKAAKSEVTASPAFAVAGVLLGALTSVFTGRLLSIGAPDLQGAIGASSDYMSWLSTAYNAANMFIGPITVFLNPLFGARKVLLVASVIFMLAEFLSPFAGHHPILLILLQVIAGLAAGTYYPLTFSMIVRNVPLKYLHYGIAAYALDILASTHIATLVESYYISNLSWHWIFYSALVTTPLLMLAVYKGIPPQPPKKDKPKSDFAGFIYASLAMTITYLGLDQGERLDWFNSPFIAACFATGLFFAVVSAVSRKIKPNPMINLGFLLNRNFLLLGFILVSFRFIILQSTLLVPNFLTVMHGYRPEQTAAVLAWVAVPTLIFAPLTGFMLYKVDSRLVVAAGFALVGLSSVNNAWLDPGWTGETFLVSQLITAAGLTTGLAGIVASLLRSAMAAGALKNPVNILVISVWFQTCRLFGAEIGKVGLSRFLEVMSDIHYNAMGAHVNGDWLTTERLQHLTAQTAGAANETASAIGVLSGQFKQQIALLSFGDGFVLTAMVALAAVIACAFLRETPPLVAEKS
jgi:DHA2 family multidrug resistance protein